MMTRLLNGIAKFTVLNHRRVGIYLALVIVSFFVASCTTHAQPAKGMSFVRNPRDATIAVLDSAKDILNGPIPGRKTPVDLNTLAMMPPLACYEVERKAVADGQVLQAAKPNAMLLYVIKAAGEPVAEVMVEVNARGAAEFISLDYRGKDITQALAELAHNDQVQAGTFEVRLLALPAGENHLPFATSYLWLKSAPGGHDLIYPLDDIPYGPLAKKLYSADDFVKLYLAHVQDAIKQQINSPASLDPNPPLDGVPPPDGVKGN